MKFAWPSFQVPLPAQQPLRPSHEEVLIETDMPELVLAERQGAPWLGLLCDTDQTGTARWLYTPLSSVERQAVLSGTVALWECFRKPEILLVDERATGADVAVLDGRRVPLEALPAPGFVLPSWARPASVADNPGPRFTLAHNAAQGGVRLRTLAAVGDTLQRLFTAITQHFVEGAATVRGSVSASVRQLAELEVEGLRAGSLVVQLKPHDPARFAEACDTLQQLLAADDAHTLADLLRTLGGRVQGRYEDLLDEIVTHDLALMVSWGPQQHAFLAAHTAMHRIEALPASAPSADDLWVTRGILLGLDAGTKTFTFYDLRTDEEISGQLAPDFKMPPRIDVGIETTPRVLELERSRLELRGGKVATRYRLLRILSDSTQPGTVSGLLAS